MQAFEKMFYHDRWSTHWFHVEGTIPESWVGEEVRLIWDSNSEAMLWIEGKPVQVGQKNLIGSMVADTWVLKHQAISIHVNSIAVVAETFHWKKIFYLNTFMVKNSF